MDVDRCYSVIGMGGCWDMHLVKSPNIILPTRIIKYHWMNFNKLGHAKLIPGLISRHCLLTLIRQG